MNAAPPPSRAPSPGWQSPQEFDECRLLRPLGRGRTGHVYLAHDTLLERSVAVKFIPGLEDSEALARFLNLNGKDLNGTDLSSFLVSVNYGPVTHYLGGNDVRVYDRVWLDGTSFWTIENGDTVYGQSFVGAEFTGNLGGGSTVKLRIRSITAAPAPNDDLRLYDVVYRNGSGAWVPACPDANGAPLLAMPVQGVWNYQQDVPGGGSKREDSERFTFACMGGAIARCVLWGYRPWATYNGTPLAQYQACTRMVRADYCGTGSSYTKTGNRINFDDTLGIHTLGIDLGL